MKLNDWVCKLKDIKEKECIEEEIENYYLEIENSEFKQLCTRDVFDNVVELIKKK